MRFEIPYDDICEALWDADMDEIENLRVNYEGRGMYGRGGCLGIVHERQTELINFSVFIADQGFSTEIRSGALQDSMGLSIITYWPDVKVTDSPGDRDD